MLRNQSHLHILCSCVVTQAEPLKNAVFFFYRQIKGCILAKDEKANQNQDILPNKIMQICFYSVTGVTRVHIADLFK